nr:hypothetical protein [uncultured Carboxylicivirga sp.]
MENKIIFLAVVLMISIVNATAQFITNNINPSLLFQGETITYQGHQIKLGPKAFYIDGQLTSEECQKNPFVFNSINEAAKHLSNGSESDPMILYIAPWVYWIDNPDDAEIRIPKTGEGVPFGLEIHCEWLKMVGLTNHPQDVILASNRGQTIGAKGNFTMLNIKGDGLSTNNLTFGNYCNVDLFYPHNPKLNRKKRASAIVQAQLIFSNGDKVMADNCHFISRLNLAPFWGSKRTLFTNCHFECTDDALNGCAVYLNCNFDFYSSKPFYNAPNTGAVFLNCDINILTHGDQYLAKEASTITMIDTRFHSNNLNYIGWIAEPSVEEKYYQYNVTLNNSPIIIGNKDNVSTVNMIGKDILNAYRLNHNDSTIYNTYNLLRGGDNWDPLNIKPIIDSIENKHKINLSSIPTQLLISTSKTKIETGKDSLMLQTELKRFGNYESPLEDINWTVDDKYNSLVKLLPKEDGNCLIIPTNTNDETKTVVINANTKTGLEASAKIRIAPSFIDPPQFIHIPKIIKIKDYLQLQYKLDMPYQDESIIKWYRCKSEDDKNPIEVAVSRFNEPMRKYNLTKADEGWYIMASIKPKHLRCCAGNEFKVLYKRGINIENPQNDTLTIKPNLNNFSTSNQARIIEGFWTVDCYKPQDTKEQNWKADNHKEAWYVGSGLNGAANDTGLIQNTKGARIRYQPVGDKFGDMKISLTAVPAKTAGQGFGSATDQYMDIGIKMDLNTMNGYALRIFRTAKFGDAVDFQLMEYNNEIATPISSPISTSCYRPNCTISVEIKDSLLIVKASNSNNYNSNSKVKKKVYIDTAIKPNTCGGILIQHTGSIGSGATLIKDLKVEWY